MAKQLKKVKLKQIYFSESMVIYIFLICKLMINQSLLFLIKVNQKPLRSIKQFIQHRFCQTKENEHFEKQKNTRYQQNVLSDFKVDRSQLIKSTVNMNELSPSFFTSKLEMFEYQKIKMEDKSKNYFTNSYVCIPLQL